MTPRGALVLVPVAGVALVPFVARPQIGIALAACAIIAWLAWRSVANVLVLAAVPPMLFGILSEQPVPEGAVTVGLSAAVLLGLLAAVHRRQEVPPPSVLVGVPMVLSLALLCLLVLRQPIGPDTAYGEEKTAFFAVTNLVLLAGGLYVGWSAARLRTLLRGTLAVSVAGAAVLLLYVAGGGDVLPVTFTFSEVDHSISMGRQMAVGLLVALAVVLGRDGAPARLVAAASLPLLAAALIASSARGPIVAAIAGVGVLLVLTLWDRVTRLRVLVVMAIVVAVIPIALAIVPATAVTRSFSFATTDVESSSSGRTDMWRESWQSITEHPELGIGTGGYIEINPPMIYPHNLLLEAWVELGLAGLLLVVWFLVHAAVRMATAFRRGPPADRVTVATLLALFTAAAVNAMFSFALHSNWEIWMWAGVGTAFAARVLGEREATAQAPAPIPAPA